MSPNDRAHITATAQNVQVIAPIYFYAFIALFRPFGLNTGSVAPYFARLGSIRAHLAPYFARLGSIRAFGRLCAHFVARIRRQLRYCPPPRGQYATRIRLCARAIALRAYAVALAYG